MILEQTEPQSASLQFGITVRAWSLVFAADAFASSRESLKAINLIALRCRRGNLRVHTSHIRSQPRYLGDLQTLGPRKAGIASIPLELLLSFRETIIDSALCDAEKKQLKYVRAAHEQDARSHDGLSFDQCLRGTNRQLCDVCMRSVAPQTDYKVRHHFLHFDYITLNFDDRLIGYQKPTIEIFSIDCIKQHLQPTTHVSSVPVNRTTSLGDCPPHPPLATHVTFV